MQTLIVALIVAAAAGYSAWRLAPASLRKAFAARSGSIARAGGASEQLARRIEIKVVAAAENAGGCGSGSCGPCKACKSGPEDGAPPPRP